MRKIIFAANDRGGMDFLVPVIKRLVMEKDYEILNIFCGPASELAIEQRLVYRDGTKLNEAQLKEIMSAFRPDVVFTGTSSGRTIEKNLWKIARKLHIFTIAAVDSWINYRLQFGFKEDGVFRIEHLPDKILVMDDFAKKEMITEDFPADKIIITGNPHFDGFHKFAPPPSKGAILTFIDQHFSELITRDVHEDMGFTEQEVFRDVIRGLNELGWIEKLIIKFHPGAADQNRYDESIKVAKFPVEKADKFVRLDDVLKQSVAVIGMTSMVLFEAALGGKFVISYQPHSRREVDPLVSNRLGLSHFACTYVDLKNILAQALDRGRKIEINRKFIERYTKIGATKKVVEAIEKSINKKN